MYKKFKDDIDTENQYVQKIKDEIDIVLHIIHNNEERIFKSWNSKNGPVELLYKQMKNSIQNIEDEII